MTESARSIAQCNVRIRWGHRILLAVAAIAIGIAIAASQVACGTVGPKAGFTREESDVNHPAGTYMSTPEPGGLAFLAGNSTANRSALSFNNDEGQPITTVDDFSVGGTNSVVAIPFLNTGKYALARLGDNSTLDVAEVTAQGTIKGLRVVRDPATSTRASNEALAAWAPVAEAFTEAQKQEVIAKLKAVENVSAAAIDLAIKALFPPAAATSTAGDVIDAVTE